MVRSKGRKRVLQSTILTENQSKRILKKDSDCRRGRFRTHDKGSDLLLGAKGKDYHVEREGLLSKVAKQVRN